MTQEEILRNLKECYSLYETLQRKKYDVPENLLKDIKILEKQYTEEVVLPLLEQQATELLKDLRCELTLSIHKDTNGSVSIHNESVEWDDVTPIIVNEVNEEGLSVCKEVQPQQVEEQEPQETTDATQKITRGARLKFKVILNGKTVKGDDGATILAETIRQIGFRRIAAMNIMFADGQYNLVDRNHRTDKDQVWQRKIDDWYIYTNISNSKKIQLLREIAEKQKLDLEVIVLEGEDPQNSVFSSASSSLLDSLSDNCIVLDATNTSEAEGRDLRITIDDKVFQEKNSIQTFIAALKYFGLDRIPQVGIMCSGYNLVDTRKRTDGTRKWQQEEDGKWVYIYFSNPTKVKYLFQIADYLHENIKIEVI